MAIVADEGFIRVMFWLSKMQQPSLASLANQPRAVKSLPATATSEVAFWVLYGVFGAVVSLVSLKSIGGTSVAAIVMQTAFALWMLGLVLRAIRYRFAGVVVGTWVVLLWIPAFLLVVRRLHYFGTTGMEEPDGMGSPAAFLIGLAVESLAFLVLTSLLLLLVRAKLCSAHAGEDVR